jgi:S1-C subfamily serine protease
MRHAATTSRSAVAVAQEATPEDAVVKIYVTKQRASMTVPWQTQQVESSTGSGTFIRRRGAAVATVAEEEEAQVQSHNIDGESGSTDLPYWTYTSTEEAITHAEGDIVLTAAHVVSDARDVRVQPHSRSGASPGKFVARVLAVSHDCDLALLEVLDEECFEGKAPMKLLGPQELLDIQSRVQVMGFPVGGDYLSITEGVVSRVEVVEYSHSRRNGLALTVDAAVNAGNSGGPVVDPSSGRMLAVAHQKVVAAGVENQGHGVPPCLIWRFLYGHANAKASRLPGLGIFMQTLESTAHRDLLELSEDDTGILVRDSNQARDVPKNVLQAGDVLMQVSSYKVDNLGAVEFLGHRVAMSAVQDLHFLGDTVRLRVRRQGKDLELQQPLCPPTYLVPRSLYYDNLTMSLDYFICGGLVFVPLSADFLEQAWPNQQDRPAHLMDLFWREAVTEDRMEAVILLSILADDVNHGHGTGYVGCPVVESVCGKSVSGLQDLAEQLTGAVHEVDFVEVDFRMSSGPYTVVLKSADVPEADERICELYQIPALTSLTGLKGV